MSLLKTIRTQLGLSGTPANNFTLDASADNGTMKLARGNAGATTQDILTVDAMGKVAFPQNAQTWQDVTSSRVSGTTYTNNTGQPIEVSVMAVGPAAGFGNAQISVAGLLVSRSYSTAVTGFSNMSNATAKVPAGATYIITWTGTPTIMELR